MVVRIASWWQVVHASHHGRHQSVKATADAEVTYHS